VRFDVLIMWPLCSSGKLSIDYQPPLFLNRFKGIKCETHSSSLQCPSNRRLAYVLFSVKSILRTGFLAQKMPVGFNWSITWYSVNGWMKRYREIKFYIFMTSLSTADKNTTTIKFVLVYIIFGHLILKFIKSGTIKIPLYIVYIVY